MGFVTVCTCHICIQFPAAHAHPADLFRRVAYHEGMVGNILCDHRPGSDKGVGSDGVAANDSTVCPQRSAFLDEGGAELVHLGDFCAGVVDVRENH